MEGYAAPGESGHVAVRRFIGELAKLTTRHRLRGSGWLIGVRPRRGMLVEPDTYFTPAWVLRVCAGASLNRVSAVFARVYDEGIFACTFRREAALIGGGVLIDHEDLDAAVRAALGIEDGVAHPAVPWHSTGSHRDGVIGDDENLAVVRADARDIDPFAGACVISARHTFALLIFAEAAS